MNCPKCNGKVSIQNKQCPFCGMDLSIYHKIFSLSNYYYNQGLEKSKVRDLSGAVESLKKSLELNKRNTNARNLLGLIYFEMGETVAALSAWVISKHLQPENNEADHYINSIQKNPTKLDALNQTIKKYNIALQSAQNANYDLAILQLKKVVTMNPHFISGLQLLALMYMKTGEKERARRCLQRALKIDVANTRTLSYLESIKLPEQELPEREEKENVIERDPNVAFMPVSSYREEKPNVRAWVNLVIGAAIGIACGYWLLVPAAKRTVHEQYKTQSTKYDQQLSVYTAQIASLENDNGNLSKKVSDLQTQLDSIVIPEYDENMYDSLFESMNLYLVELAKPEEDRDMTDAAKALLKVKESALENKSVESLYETIKMATFPSVASKLYKEGHDAYSAGKYDEAEEILLSAYDYDSKNPDVIYFIGRTYHRKGDNEKAKKYYNLIIKNFADTSRYAEAKQRLNEIGD